MPSVRLGDVELHHEVEGRGPPLVLLAGLGSDSLSWLPVRSELGDRFTLLLLDNRGVGRTRPADAPVSIAAMAADVAALLDHLGIPRAHVLGHSMGGLIALELASRWPERVDRLVLAASGVLDARARTLLEDLARARESGLAFETWVRLLFPWLFAPAFFEDPGAVARAARMAASHPYLQTAAAFRAQVRASCERPADRGERVRAETLVLTGERDLLVPGAASAATFAGVPSRRTAVLHGAAHSLHWDAPDAFLAAVTRFLGG